MDKFFKNLLWSFVYLVILIVFIDSAIIAFPLVHWWSVYLIGVVLVSAVSVIEITKYYGKEVITEFSNLTIKDVIALSLGWPLVVILYFLYNFYELNKILKKRKEVFGDMSKLKDIFWSASVESIYKFWAFVFLVVAAHGDVFSATITHRITFVLAAGVIVLFGWNDTLEKRIKVLEQKTE